MDNESNIIMEFIGRVGAANARLTEFAAKVHSHPNVVQASSALECVKYQYNDPMIDGYVDAELAGGDAVSWVINVSWTDDRWLISSSIAVKRAEYQETLKQFPDHIASTFAELLTELDSAVSDLVGSIEYLDVADRSTSGE